jgi:hypothetical protein
VINYRINHGFKFGDEAMAEPVADYSLIKALAEPVAGYWLSVDIKKNGS